MSVNVGATKHGKSLLRSMSAARDLSVSDVSLLQGVMIVRDWQRGVYVNVVKASGTDSSGTNITFEKVHSDMVKASKKPADGKVFEESYPFKRPPSGTQGGVEGVYADLKMLVGIAIDTSQSTECLTRLDKGMFYWSERTLNKIESANNDDKRFELVLSMFTLFLSLMLDVTESLSQGTCFEEFMREFNFLLKSNS